MDWFSSATPLIIGHRGASAGAPENTLAAFGLAADEGAHGVELDVRLSADGVPIVMHDATVDRTTDGMGAVSKLVAAQLKNLDAGMGQAVPTLDDVFQTFGPSLLYNVEIKAPGLWNEDVILAVADRVGAYHLENQVVVSSFNPFVVRRARRHLARTTMLAVVWDRGPYRLWQRLARTQADHPHFSRVSEGYMGWARQQGLRVHVWTVDNPGEAQRLTRLGVNAIITNEPGLMREAVDHASLNFEIYGKR